MAIYELLNITNDGDLKRNQVKGWVERANKYSGGMQAFADIVAKPYTEISGGKSSRFEGLVSAAYENADNIGMTEEQIKKDPGKAAYKLYNMSRLDIAHSVFESVYEQTGNRDVASDMADHAFNHYTNQVMSQDPENRDKVFVQQATNLLKYDKDGTAYTDVSDLRDMYGYLLSKGVIEEEYIPFGNKLENFKVKTIASRNMDVTSGRRNIESIWETFLPANFWRWMSWRWMSGKPDTDAAKTRAYQEQHGKDISEILWSSGTNMAQTLLLTMATQGVGKAVFKGVDSAKYIKNVTSSAPMAVNVLNSALMDNVNEQYGFNERYFNKILRNETTNQWKYWVTRGYDLGTYAAGTYVGSRIIESKMFGKALTDIAGKTGMDAVRALAVPMIKYPLADTASDLFIDVATANTIHRFIPGLELTDPTRMSMEWQNDPERDALEDVWSNFKKFGQQALMRLGGRIAGGYVKYMFGSEMNKERNYQNLLGSNRWADAITKSTNLNAFDKTTLKAYKIFNRVFSNSVPEMDRYWMDMNDQQRLVDGMNGDLFKRLSPDDKKGVLTAFYFGMEASKNLVIHKTHQTLVKGISKTFGLDYVDPLSDIRWGKQAPEEKIIDTLNRVHSISAIGVDNETDIKDLAKAVGDDIYDQTIRVENRQPDNTIDQIMNKFTASHVIGDNENKKLFRAWVNYQINKNYSAEPDKASLLERFKAAKETTGTLYNKAYDKTVAASELINYTDYLHKRIEMSRGNTTVDGTIIGKRAFTIGGVEKTSLMDADELNKKIEGETTKISEGLQDMFRMLDEQEDVITRISGRSFKEPVRAIKDKVNFVIQRGESPLTYHDRIRREISEAVGEHLTFKLDGLKELLSNGAKNLHTGQNQNIANAGKKEVSSQVVIEMLKIKDLLTLFPEHAPKIERFNREVFEAEAGLTPQARALFNNAMKESPIYKIVNTDLEPASEQLLQMFVYSNVLYNKKEIVSNTLRQSESLKLGVDNVIMLATADTFDLNAVIAKRIIRRNPGFSPTNATNVYVKNNEVETKFGARELTVANDNMAVMINKEAMDVMLKEVQFIPTILPVLYASLIKYDAMKDSDIDGMKNKGIEGYNKTKSLLDDVFNIKVLESDDKIVIDHTNADHTKASTALADAGKRLEMIQLTSKASFTVEEMGVPADHTSRPVTVTAKIKGTDVDMSYKINNISSAYKALYEGSPSTDGEVIDLALSVKDVATALPYSDAVGATKNLMELYNYEFTSRLSDEQYDQIAKMLVDGAYMNNTIDVTLTVANDIISSKGNITNVTKMYNGITMIDTELLEGKKLSVSEMRGSNLHLIQEPSNSLKAVFAHFPYTIDDGYDLILDNFKELHSSNSMDFDIAIKNTFGVYSYDGEIREGTLSADMVDLVTEYKSKPRSETSLHEFLKAYVGVYKKHEQMVIDKYNKGGKYKKPAEVYASDAEKSINDLITEAHKKAAYIKNLSRIIRDKESGYAISELEKYVSDPETLSSLKNAIDMYNKIPQTDRISKSDAELGIIRSIENAIKKVTDSELSNIRAYAVAQGINEANLSIEEGRIVFIKDLPQKFDKVSSILMDKSIMSAVNKASSSIKNKDEAITNSLQLLIATINAYETGKGGNRKRFSSVSVQDGPKNTPAPILKMINDTKDHKKVVMYVSNEMNVLNGASAVTKYIKDGFDATSSTGEGGKLVKTDPDGSMQKHEMMTLDASIDLFRRYVATYAQSNNLKIDYVEDKGYFIDKDTKQVYHFMLIDVDENVKSMGPSLRDRLLDDTNVTSLSIRGVRKGDGADVVDYARAYTDNDLFDKHLLSMRLQEAQQKNAGMSSIDYAASYGDPIQKYNMNLETQLRINEIIKDGKIAKVVEQITKGDPTDMNNLIMQIYSEIVKIGKFSGWFGRNLPLLDVSYSDRVEFKSTIYNSDGRVWNKKADWSIGNQYGMPGDKSYYGTFYYNKVGMGAINLLNLLQEELKSYGIKNSNLKHYTQSGDKISTSKTKLSAAEISGVTSRLSDGTYDDSDIKNALSYLAHNRKGSGNNIVIATKIDGQEQYMVIPNRTPSVGPGAVSPALIVGIFKNQNGNMYSGAYAKLTGGDFDGDQSSYWKEGSYVKALKSTLANEGIEFSDDFINGKGPTDDFVDKSNMVTLSNLRARKFGDSYSFGKDIDGMDPNRLADSDQHTMDVGLVSSAYDIVSRILTNIAMSEKGSLGSKINAAIKDSVGELKGDVTKEYAGEQWSIEPSRVESILERSTNSSRIVLADEITTDNKYTGNKFYGSFRSIYMSDNNIYKHGDKKYKTGILSADNGNKIGVVLDDNDSIFGYKVISAYDLESVVGDNEYLANTFRNSLETGTVSGSNPIIAMEGKRLMDQHLITSTINKLGVENVKYLVLRNRMGENGELLNVLKDIYLGLYSARGVSISTNDKSQLQIYMGLTFGKERYGDLNDAKKLSFALTKIFSTGEGAEVSDDIFNVITKIGKSKSVSDLSIMEEAFNIFTNKKYDSFVSALGTQELNDERLRMLDPKFLLGLSKLKVYRNLSVGIMDNTTMQKLGISDPALIFTDNNVVRPKLTEGNFIAITELLEMNKLMKEVVSMYGFVGRDPSVAMTGYLIELRRNAQAIGYESVSRFEEDIVSRLLNGYTEVGITTSKEVRDALANMDIQIEKRDNIIGPIAEQKLKAILVSEYGADKFHNSTEIRSKLIEGTKSIIDNESNKTAGVVLTSKGKVITNEELYEKYIAHIKKLENREVKASVDEDTTKKATGMSNAKRMQRDRYKAVFESMIPLMDPQTQKTTVVQLKGLTKEVANEVIQKMKGDDLNFDDLKSLDMFAKSRRIVSTSNEAMTNYVISKYMNYNKEVDTGGGCYE